MGIHVYQVRTATVIYRDDPAMLEFRDGGFGAVTVECTEAVRAQLTAIVRGWADDAEAEDRGQNTPVCDHCGEPVVPAAYVPGSAGPRTDWQHVGGLWRCATGERRYATVNGSEVVPGA